MSPAKSICGSLIVALVLASCSTVASHDWAVVDARDSELTIVIVGGNTCSSLDRVEVEEDEASVYVTAFVRQQTGPFACTDDVGSIETTKLQLDAPLGSRTLTGCDLSETAYFTNPNGTPRDECREIVDGYD